MSQSVGGGVARHIGDIVNHAGEIEHAIVLPPNSIPQGSGAAYDELTVLGMRRRGVALHHMEMRRSVSDARNLLAIMGLRRMFLRIQPSVLHAHSSVAGAMVRLANLPRSIPVIYSPNGLTTDPLGRAVERALGRLAARVVAVSESEAQRARKWRVTEPSKIVVIPNGIELDPPPPEVDIRSELGIPPGVPLVGTISRLVAQKAPELFVRVAGEVVRQRPDAHFLMIGMGPLQRSVELAVANEGLADRFHRIPHLDKAASVLDQLDVFVLASRFEGGPYAPLEAIRAGTPVVLSDVVGNRDVVDDGVSGFLVPFGDSAKMANSVVGLLENRDLRTSITRAAHERLCRKFDVRQMGAALRELYEEVAVEWSRRTTRRLPHPRLVTSAQAPDSRAAV